MRINIFTKIMLALVSVITILSAVFIYTSLNNADDWAGRQTIEFRDSLKDKYKILLETVAGNLQSDFSPNYNQLGLLISKHPEIKSIKIIKQTDRGEYKIINQISTTKADEPKKETTSYEIKSTENEHGSMSESSGDHDSPINDSDGAHDDAKSEKTGGHSDDSSAIKAKEAGMDKSKEKIELSLSELKDLENEKSIISFEGDIAGHSGSHDVMTDEQFLKVIEPFNFPNMSGYKINTKAAVVAEISLVEPLKEIHMRHLETSGHFIQISLIAGVLSTLLALLVGGFIARGITQPVKKLMNVAEDVSMGRNVQDIDIKSNDEIGDLADSFQRMVTAVKFLTIKEGDEDESISADS